MTGQEIERADVLAYLRQRHRAATTVALHGISGASDRAAEIARSIAVQIEMIEQGLHEGAAATAAAIAGESTNGKA